MRWYRVSCQYYVSSRSGVYSSKSIHTGQRRELEIKLLKSSQRKDEQMRAVKERAALANQNARMVASRVQAARGSASSTPERGSPFGGVGAGGEAVCLVCQAEVRGDCRGGGLCKVWC